MEFGIVDTNNLTSASVSSYKQADSKTFAYKQF